MTREPHWIASPSPVYPTRRDFLKRTGSGFGLLALLGLLEQEGLLCASASEASRPASAALNPLAPRPSHFPAKAKSVIWLFMNGGPSQVDTWDYKPELENRHNQEFAGFDNNTGFFTNQVARI